MYLLDIAVHNLACLEKKGMLLIQSNSVSSWETLHNIIEVAL